MTVNRFRRSIAVEPQPVRIEAKSLGPGDRRESLSRKFVRQNIAKSKSMPTL
jgi:hypothetical protein